MDAFNARLISALSSDRFYRVLVDRGEVYLIQVGGQSGEWTIVDSRMLWVS